MQLMKTTIIGILNVSPDSFSGDGITDITELVKKAEQMLTDGADILDIGGESTRLGAEPISIDEELHRVIPALTAVKKAIGNTFPISIDTYKSEIAKQSLEHGATTINSLGGFTYDKKLAEVIARYKCPFIFYHIKGTPKTMNTEIKYDDVVADIKKWADEQIRFGLHHGMEPTQFLLDPGIGFAKTPQQSIELIKRLREFKSFELPIVIGVSRKKHLGVLLQQELKLKDTPGITNCIPVALAETAIAITNGATHIRTHDVLETKRFIAAYEVLTQ